jgi:predicted ABC-type ATPase
VAPSKAERPIFWIFGGPNGSGKSSAYADTSFQADGQTIWIVNPDLLTARIQKIEGLELGQANIQSVVRIEAWLDASIGTHKSVGVETVLSTGKYRRLVTKAKTLGFEVRLTYVILNSPDLNVERVRLRVAKGGHDVPEDKIRERYVKSLQQLPWFFDEADRVLLYDNSGAEPVKILEKSGPRVDIYSRALPAVLSALGLNSPPT